MNNLSSMFEQTKEAVYLKDYAEAHLDHANGGLVCPCCNSGTGPNGTPAFSIDNNTQRWHCFSCGEGGDVFDLAGIIVGTQSRAEQLHAVQAWAGMRMPTFSYDGSNYRTAAKLTGAAKGRRDAEDREAEAEREAEQKAERQRRGRDKARGYIVQARGEMTADCPGSCYLLKRGFTLQEIKRFGFGWDPQHRRVVIPWSMDAGEYYHIDRDITGNAKAKYTKPKAEDVGPQPIHNAAALNGPYVFVVEGLMDAYAVEAAGYPAIALAGASNYRSLAERIREKKYSGSVIIALDNDAAGRSNTDKLYDALKGAAANVWAVEYPAEWPADSWGKDPSGALEHDREGLKAWLDDELGWAEGKRKEEAEQRYNEAMRSMRALDPVDTVGDIFTLSDAEDPVPTGLASLDLAIGGGLKRGVYVLGAISSLGKTTLTIQIADHIAAEGRNVLFVTIEQSAREIVSKSLTRLMRQRSGGASYGRVSAHELTDRSARKSWGAAKNSLFLEVCNEYTNTTAQHLRILEATEQPSVKQIRDVAAAMAEHDGEPPVVFIDYLQLLAAPDERDSDKQATDKNMMALRQMARDLKTPVFVISSLNRSSYSGSISIDSFKESGGIEYGADVLLGLQPEGMTEQLDGMNDAKAKAEAGRIVRGLKTSAVRSCEVVVLKNRNGSMPPRGIALRFDAPAATFTVSDATVSADSGPIVL